MDHTRQGHRFDCGHIPHHIWCAHTPHTHCCPHIPLVHESMVRGEAQANGSLGGALVRKEKSIQACTWAWHPQDLLVAHHVVTHHHCSDRHTVLVVDWVPILLARPTLWVICDNYMTWCRGKRRVGCFGWSKATWTPLMPPFDHHIHHTSWDCGTTMKNASDTTVLTSVFSKDVQICINIKNPRLYDAYFEDFAYIIHHGRLQK